MKSPNKILILTLLAFAALACSTGCVAVAQDDTRLSLTWSTGLVWEQTGPVDKDRRSELGVDIDDEFKKPLVDHFLPASKDEDQTAPNEE